MKKRISALLATVLLMGGGSAALARMMEHSKGSHTQMSGQTTHEGGMKMPEGMEMKSLQIDDYKVNFHVMDHNAFRNYMDNMGHASHKMKPGMTHYVMMDITGSDGKKISRAKVKLKIVGPDGKAQEKTAFSMMGSFGAEFVMRQKGKYQVMTLFKTGDTKHKGGFWHEMK